MIVTHKVWGGVLDIDPEDGVLIEVISQPSDWAFMQLVGWAPGEDCFCGDTSYRDHFEKIVGDYDVNDFKKTIRFPDAEQAAISAGLMEDDFL